MQVPHHTVVVHSRNEMKSRDLLCHILATIDHSLLTTVISVYCRKIMLSWLCASSTVNWSKR